jgi:hypothetical protein
VADTLVDQIATASRLDPDQRREFEDRAGRLANADLPALDATFKETFNAAQKGRHSPVHGATLSLIEHLKEAKLAPARKAARERDLARQARDRTRSDLYRKLSAAAPNQRPAILAEINALDED